MESLIFFCGALTSQPYTFTARPWECKSFPAIDMLDGTGSNVRIDFKETKIVRVLPRINYDINKRFISDKTRFYHDALYSQRLKIPYSKTNKNLIKIKWSHILQKISAVIQVYAKEYGHKWIGVVTGASIDIETFYTVRKFVQLFGFFNLGMDHQINIPTLDSPMYYRFNHSYRNVDECDFCLFLTTNLKYEASLLNMRLYQTYYNYGKKAKVGYSEIRDKEDIDLIFDTKAEQEKIQKDTFVDILKPTIEFSSVGAGYSSSYPVQSVSLTPLSILEVVEGKHTYCKKLCNAKNPVILCGSDMYKRFDAMGIILSLNLIASYIKKKNLFNFVHYHPNSVGGYEIGFSNLNKEHTKYLKLVYCIQTQLEIFNYLKSSSLVLLQNSHGNACLIQSDFVLPAPIFLETTGTYLNMEGRSQRSYQALAPFFLVREDWKILRALSFYLKKPLMVTSKYSILVNLCKILPSSLFPLLVINWDEKINYINTFVKCMKEKLLKSSFTLPIENIENFYMTPYICQFSKVLAKAAKLLKTNDGNFRFLDDYMHTVVQNIRVFDSDLMENMVEFYESTIMYTSFYDLTTYLTFTVYDVNHDLYYEFPTLAEDDFEEPTPEQIKQKKKKAEDDGEYEPGLCSFFYPIDYDIVLDYSMIYYNSDNHHTFDFTSNYCVYRNMYKWYTQEKIDQKSYLLYETICK